MSGGLDSSVAACLLADEGYEVVGITMRLHDAEPTEAERSRACCSLDMVQDAKGVCDVLGMPHYTVDMRKAFGSAVQQDFVTEYLSGRTPNPCIRCNSVIKWRGLYQKAQEIGAQYFATGHHALVVEDPQYNGRVLKCATDAKKDQSYALWGISREHLQRTLLPIGKMHKSEAREYAERKGLKNAGKADSQDICFIPDGDYGRFLQGEQPEISAQVGEGDIVTMDGSIIGRHKGFPYYTVGQRKGLGIATGQPQFVVHIDPEQNTLLIGDEGDLYQRECLADQVNWQAMNPPNEPMRVMVKIRYSDPGASATIETVDNNQVRVKFDEPRRAITPGQSAVWYDGDTVIGGGVILRAGLDPRK